jgi:hypothetical protein
MYDIFFLGNANDKWDALLAIYPTARRLEKNISLSDIRKRAFTKMFWVVWDNLILTPDFNLNEYRATQWDNEYVHVFKNGDYFDGICLIPKSADVSQREFENRFFVNNKKEIDIVATKPIPYDIFYINSYNEYLATISASTTDMFWVVWNDVIISDNFKFDYQVPAYNTHIPHVFKNGKFFDGICIFPTTVTVTKKEFDNRFFVNDKKEIDILASYPTPYNIFYIDTYDEYLDAKETSKTEMFWVVWKDVVVNDDFKFDYKVPKYEQHIPHVFKNGEYFDGICIFSKEHTVAKKEFDNRFFVNNKKEIDILASQPKPFDIIFISYNEVNADENYNKLLARFPRAKRIHGVKGIHQAHIEAAKLCETEMLWVVDADAMIVDDFDFTVEQIPYYSSNARRMLTTTVHVWRSRNPINDLEYGYGGVKLLPRQMTLDMDVSSADMTTSISKSFKAMPEVSNITMFNTDSFSTWRSAFRECCKLSSKIIDGQLDDETAHRLDTWITVAHGEFSDDALNGATAGKYFGLFWQNAPSELAKINDFDWLKEQYEIR